MSAHHPFYKHCFFVFVFHFVLLLYLDFFFAVIALAGVVFRAVGLCRRLFHLEEIEPQGVCHNTKARKTHGRRAEHRIKLPSKQAYKNSCGKRYSYDVVNKGPEKIFLDIPQSLFGKLYCPCNLAQTAAGNDHIGRIYGNIGARSHGDSHICGGKGGSVVYSVAHHNYLSA